MRTTTPAVSRLRFAVYLEFRQIRIARRDRRHRGTRTLCSLVLRYFHQYMPRNDREISAQLLDFTAMNSHSFHFEHVALNTEDYERAVQWYIQNLGLSVARDTPGEKTFLRDAGGRTVLEVYSNRNAPVLDFEDMHYLSLHIAFAVDDPDAAAEALVSAGASIVDPPRTVEGDRLVMLKDPYGIAIQLIRRSQPMP